MFVHWSNMLALNEHGAYYRHRHRNDYCSSIEYNSNNRNYLERAALNCSSVIQVVQNFDLKTTVKDNIETLISNVSFFIKSLVFWTFFHSKFKWNLFLIDILHHQSLHFHHKFFFFVFDLFMKWDWLNVLFDFFLQHWLEWMFLWKKKKMICAI